jgi:hypothetical protein
MSAPKLTPWFPGHIKPVRPGVYQTLQNCDGVGPFLQYWNGRFWGLMCRPNNGIDLPERWKNDSSSNQHCRWRGLAEEPK